MELRSLAGRVLYIIHCGALPGNWFTGLSLTTYLVHFHYFAGSGITSSNVDVS
jgi:hypothetical protein